jgi:hypothetical protein
MLRVLVAFSSVSMACVVVAISSCSAEDDSDADECSCDSDIDTDTDSDVDDPFEYDDCQAAVFAEIEYQSSAAQLEFEPVDVQCVYYEESDVDSEGMDLEIVAQNQSGEIAFSFSTYTGELEPGEEAHLSFHHEQSEVSGEGDIGGSFDYDEEGGQVSIIVSGNQLAPFTQLFLCAKHLAYGSDPCI